MLFETKVALENYKNYLNELKLKDKEINFEKYKSDLKTQINFTFYLLGSSYRV